VQAMKPGSVVVDLAVEQGGNCPLSQPNAVVDVNGVKIVGYTNLPGMVAADASALYARNVLDFLKLVFNAEGQFNLDLTDEIVKACLICTEGGVLKVN
jgi:NAD(P) transhydrogenase subunit alpha